LFQVKSALAFRQRTVLSIVAISWQWKVFSSKAKWNELCEYHFSSISTKTWINVSENHFVKVDGRRQRLPLQYFATWLRVKTAHRTFANHGDRTLFHRPVVPKVGVNYTPG